MNPNQPASPKGLPSDIASTELSPEGGREFDPREQLEIFWRRRWSILAVTILIVALGAAYTFTRPKIYESTTKLALITDSGKATSLASSDILGALGDLDKTRNVATQAELLQSLDLLDKAYDQLSKKQKLKGFGVEKIPTWSYTILSRPDSDVVSITARSYNKQLAADLATAIVNTYLEGDKERNNKTTQLARVFVENERKTTQDQLAISTKDLAKYQRETGLVAADVQISQEAQKTIELKATAEQARTSLAGADRQLLTIQAELTKLDPNVVAMSTIQENPEYTFVRSKISQLQSDITEALQEYTPDAPEVVKIKQEISTEQQRLKDITKRTMVTSTSQQRNPMVDKLAEDFATIEAQKVLFEEQVSSYTAAYNARQTLLTKFPEQQRKLAELQQRVDILKRTYNMLSDQYYSLLIQERSGQPYGFVVSTARPANQPASPKVLQNMVGFVFAGIFFGILAALLLERLDTRVHDPMFVDRATGLTTLTAVPETVSTDPNNERLLIGGVENNHAFLEAFRLLRNNITFSSPDKELRILAVTSPSKSEGKSTISVNLAIAMALDGKRVLLVDCDLRRPMVHNWMNLNREVGFTTVVKGLNTLEDAIRETSHENLWALTSGPLPPNPTEFLNSQQARATLVEASKLYDVVLLDSPPCTGLSDVQVISTLADGMVLVVALNSTFKQYLIATMRMLRQAGAPLLGTVLNRMNYQRSSYNYYASTYYYYYYNQYYEEDDSPRKKRKKGGRGKKKNGSSNGNPT